MNRRGNILDAFAIMALLFTGSIVMIMMLMLVGVFKDAIVADTSLPLVARDMIQSGEAQLPAIYDFWTAILFIGLPLISAIFAYFNNIHPLFFWLSLILVVLVVLFGAAYTQIWDAMGDDADLRAQMDRLPMTDMIFSNFGKYSLLIVVFIALGTYVKLRGAQQGPPGGFYG